MPIPQLKRTEVKRPAKASAKKAKAAAGGTALLGLVTLLCLTGTIPSWPGSSSVPAQQHSHVSNSPMPSYHTHIRLFLPGSQCLCCKCSFSQLSSGASLIWLDQLHVALKERALQCSGDHGPYSAAGGGARRRACAAVCGGGRPKCYSRLGSARLGARNRAVTERPGSAPREICSEGGQHQGSCPAASEGISTAFNCGHACSATICERCLDKEVLIYVESLTSGHAEMLGLPYWMLSLHMLNVQDLAPITLYTDWGLEGGVSNVWRNVQGSGGRGSDLKPPMQCREVGIRTALRILEF